MGLLNIIFYSILSYTIISYLIAIIINLYVIKNYNKENYIPMNEYEKTNLKVMLYLAPVVLPSIMVIYVKKVFKK